MGSITVKDLIGAYSASDFGIRGDGNGDMGRLLNEAMLHVSQQTRANGMLFIPPGTYRVGETSITPLSNITLFGMGSASVFQLGAGCNIDVLRASGISQFALKNLKIDGNRANNPSGTRHGVWMSGVTDAWLEDVEITSCRYDGFWLYDCERVELKGCMAHDNGRHGIALSYSRYNLLITPRSYDNCKVSTAGTANGIHFELLSGDNTVIAPVAYETALAGDAQGYGVREAVGEGCYRNMVIGGAERGNKTAGISLESRDSMAFTPDFVRYLTASVVNPS